MSQPKPQPFVTTPIPCPGCGQGLQGHAPVGDLKDRERATLCAHCATISIFVTVDGQLTLRAPTDEERDALLRHPEMQKAIYVARRLREAGLA